MATNAELIALFGDDFESVLAGLSKLPPEARELLDQAMGKMLYDADVFSSRVNKAVQTQAAAGMSANAIKAGLLNDMQTGGRVFGEIRNSVKGSLVEGINQSSRAGQFQALDPESDTLFTWVTIAGHKVCLDCAPRGGQQKTLKEWEQEGLPGAGWSVCKGYCYCIIDPSGKISPRLQMEGVVEKGATVRKKAVVATGAMAWKPSMTTQEAVEWAKDSEFQGVRLHGTTVDGVKGITKRGFDTTKIRTGQIYGKGGYSTATPEVATAFASESGVTMKLMYRVKNPFILEAESLHDILQGNIPQSKNVIKKGFEKHLSRGKMNIFERYYNKILKDRPFKDFVTNQPLNKQQMRDRWFGSASGFEKKAWGKQALDMGDRWWNYLDDLVIAGDETAIAYVDDIIIEGKISQQFNANFPELWTNFLKKEGYDSLRVNNVGVPIPGKSIFDDYFIAFDKKSISAIVDD